MKRIIQLFIFLIVIIHQLNGNIPIFIHKFINIIIFSFIILFVCIMFIINIIMIMIDELNELIIKNFNKISLLIVFSFIIIIFLIIIISDIIHIVIQLLHDISIIIIIGLNVFISIFNCNINKRFITYLLYQSNPLYLRYFILKNIFFKLQV